MATYTITLNERTTSGKAIKKSAMRHLCSKLLLTALISMLCATSFAHDIAVANSDGVTIYYNFINDNTELAVTYRGSTWDEYADEYSGDVVIPKTVTYSGKSYRVTSIGYYAFQSCSSLASVTIPNSVTNISGYAFQSCSSLTSITIPNSVTSIGEVAFSSCTSLTSVHISDLVAWCNINFGAESANPLSAAHHLYLNGVEVKDLVIPNSVTSIGNNSFFGCSGLTSVTIPNSVTSIGNNSFSGCSGLTSVTIPNSVTSIGGGAFRNCSNLASVTIPNSVTSIGGGAFRFCRSLTSVTLPNSVTSIGSYTFSYCNRLTSINIPPTVTSIGESAFEQCSSLTSVHISDLAAWCNISFTNAQANPLNRAHHLYLNGEEVKDLVIPESVTDIGAFAFEGCSGLTSVTIPNSVTSIGNSAFYSCTGLTSVTIPNSVTSIKPYAFEYCRGLTSVTIPNSITTILSATFAHCSNLTSLTIPNSVTSIKGLAFNDCPNLTYVKVENKTPPSIVSTTFSNRANATLYVPRGSKENYENADYWTEFKEIVEYDPITVLDDNSEDEPPSYPVPMDVKVQRTIKGGEWSTICLPFAMTGTQISAALGSIEIADFAGYRVTKIGNKTTAILINFTPVDPADGMEANHPYIIKIADDIEEFSVQEVILAPDEENAQTAFTTTEDGQEVTKGHFIGTYRAQTVVPADDLFISANKFYYSTGKTKMQAYRAYFALADRLDRDQAASAKITFMFNDTSTDRIEELEVQHAVSSAVFDLGGRKVADSADGILRLPKGVYIVNGKKVVR